MRELFIYYIDAQYIGRTSSLSLIAKRLYVVCFAVNGDPGITFLCANNMKNTYMEGTG